MASDSAGSCASGFGTHCELFHWRRNPRWQVKPGRPFDLAFVAADANDDMSRFAKSQKDGGVLVDVS
jgi:hypothetical protein